MMLDSFHLILAALFGLFLGIVMCIPIGPLNIITINLTLDGKKKKALAIASGGSLMDFAYFFIILSGLSLFSFSESMTFAFKILGVCVLFLMGAIEIKKYYFPKIEKEAPALSVEEEELKLQKNIKTKNHYVLSVFLGVFIYVSNPTLVATMTGLSAFVKSTEIFEPNFKNVLGFSLCAGLGSFSWFYFLAMFVDRYKGKFSDKLLGKLNFYCGILIIIAATIMSTRLIFKI